MSNSLKMKMDERPSILLIGLIKKTQQVITVAGKLINYYSHSMHAATVINLLLLQQSREG